MIAHALCVGGLLVLHAAMTLDRPAIAYTVRLDSAHADVIDVAMELRHVAPVVLLAMKVHAEYDARYWRHLDGLRIDGTRDDVAASIVRVDSTVWRLTMPGGGGVVHYRVHVQPPAQGLRRSWQTYARADGALLNPPDVFLYLPAFVNVAARVTLDAPAGWRVATALDPRTGRSYAAADAATLLDSPILAGGSLREWRFAEGQTIYHVVYWPLSEAAPFDTAALVDDLHRIVRAADAIFGSSPSRDYWFLLQDGASDALEHRASVTLGFPAARLARDDQSLLPEITHELFHSWNLVSIRPVGYNDLSYRRPSRTSGLWFGEGVTLYYADLLPRRAGLAPATPSRLDHLAALLERYYSSPAIMRVSPQRASLAFGDSPARNADATGGYYLQGELLADALDARIRSATRERRGLDDVMRRMYKSSRSPGYRGFYSGEVVRAVDAVCRCRMDAFFAQQVHHAGPIDPAPILDRLGLRLVVDSIPATDSAGHPLADVRVGMDFTSSTAIRLVVSDSTTAFARAGIRTGDELVAVDGTPVATFAAMRGALGRYRKGDTAVLRMRRDAREMTVDVPLHGYVRPRVRFLDAPRATDTDRRRRAAWLAGL